jgi:hypothetical protein
MQDRDQRRAIAVRNLHRGEGMVFSAACHQCEIGRRLKV